MAIIRHYRKPKLNSNVNSSTNRKRLHGFDRIQKINVDCDVQKEFIEHYNKRDLKEIKDTVDSNKPITDYEGLCVKCRKIMESIFTTKYLFELQTTIDSKGSIRSFTEKLKGLSINGFNNSVKYNKFIILCDNLNIKLHNNSFSNEGGNAHAILADFLNSIKEI